MTTIIDSLSRRPGRALLRALALIAAATGLAGCGGAGSAGSEKGMTIVVAGQGVVRDVAAASAIDCREGGSPADCQETYPATQLVALQALPDAGWSFVGWGGDCADQDAGPGITVLAAEGLGCTASFVPVSAASMLVVRIGNAAAGQVVDSQPLGIRCSVDAGNDCSKTLPTGTSVTLHATLLGLASWQGCDEVLDINYCRLTLTRSRTVTASYGP